MAASGCSVVSTTVPIGEPAAEAETKEFVGTWVAPNGETVYVQHAGDNRLRLAGVSWDKKKTEFKLEELDCLITKDEDQLYANIRKLDPDGERTKEAGPSYHFGRLVLSDPDQLLLVDANPEAFAKAVREGTIAGRIEEAGNFTTITLEPTTSQLSDFVTPSKAAEQFVLEAPMVLRRIHRFEDKPK